MAVMSLPSWVWIEGQDFPRLYSWNEKARTEIMKAFQYHTDMVSRVNLKLQIPNFSTFTYDQWCQESKNLSDYCSLSSQLPDLDTTLQLMSLARNLDHSKEILEEKLQ